jgi:hypothetical protein
MDLRISALQSWAARRSALIDAIDLHDLSVGGMLGGLRRPACWRTVKVSLGSHSRVMLSRLPAPALGPLLVRGGLCLRRLMAG